MRLLLRCTMSILFLSIFMTTAFAQSTTGTDNDKTVEATNSVSTNESDVAAKDEASTNISVKTGKSNEVRLPGVKKPMSIMLTYGAGSLISGSFYYRFTPNIRAGLGVGYTVPGDWNSGVNILASLDVNIYSLDLKFMTIDFSLMEHLLFFSDNSTLFMGVGPAVFFTINSFPAMSLGVVNDFYFRDTGPVYQLGFALSVNF